MKNTLKYASNYDEIISFIFDEEDFITKRIINYYKEYLLDTKGSDNKCIRELDESVYEYLTDNKFNIFVTNYLEELEESNDDIDYYNNLDINLPKLYKRFKSDSLNTISSTRWL